MLEKIIEKKITEYAKKCGILSYKLNSISCRGLPDRMFLLPKGKIHFIELKRKGKKPTELQNLKIQELLDRGFLVEVVDDVDYGLKVVDKWMQTN